MLENSISFSEFASFKDEVIFKMPYFQKFLLMLQLFISLLFHGWNSNVSNILLS